MNDEIRQLSEEMIETKDLIARYRFELKQL